MSAFLWNISQNLSSRVHGSTFSLRTVDTCPLLRHFVPAIFPNTWQVTIIFPPRRSSSMGTACHFSAAYSPGSDVRLLHQCIPAVNGLGKYIKSPPSALSGSTRLSIHMVCEATRPHVMESAVIRYMTDIIIFHMS